ncbi:MAG: phosphatase PAP2 family protein [Gemmatimonadales bacterium]
MPVSHPLRPVDRWIAVLNITLAGTWLGHWSGSPWAAYYVLAFLLAALLPALLVRLPIRLSPVASAVRDGYPLAWIGLVWGTLGLRMGEGLLGGANDALVARWDLALFGQHLNLAWMPAMPWAWFSESMYACYNAYYLLLVAVPAWFILRGCPRTAREVILRLAVTYAACFLVYAVFPVIGPMEMLPRFTPDTEGLFRSLSGAARAAGDSLGTAFPSSHTAGSIALAWITWRLAPRPVAVVVAMLALAVACATVYTQNHFAVDTLAGIAIAAATLGVLVPWLEAGGLRLPGPARRATPVAG